jgi:hypothetical protein
MLGPIRHSNCMLGHNMDVRFAPTSGGKADSAGRRRCVTLIIWTSLTISLDGQPTANIIMLKMLEQIYTVSPLQ